MSPLFWDAASASGLVRGGREEALTQNISHAPRVVGASHVPCRVVHAAAIPEPERKGTLHATHTPGSARRPAAQKFELFDIWR